MCVFFRLYLGKQQYVLALGEDTAVCQRKQHLLLLALSHLLPFTIFVWVNLSESNVDDLITTE